MIDKIRSVYRRLVERVLRWRYHWRYTSPLRGDIAQLIALEGVREAYSQVIASVESRRDFPSVARRPPTKPERAKRYSEKELAWGMLILGAFLYAADRHVADIEAGRATTHPDDVDANGKPAIIAAMLDAAIYRDALRDRAPERVLALIP